MIEIEDFKNIYKLQAAYGSRICRGMDCFNFNAEKKHHLDTGNIEELSKNLIDVYTGLLFDPLNRYLRKKEKDTNPFLDHCVKVLNKVLQNFPAFNNSISYRNEMTSYEKEIKAWFNKIIGQNVLFPSFISTYKSRENWKFSEPLFEFRTNNNSKAVDISDLTDRSRNIKETEVLFQSKTCFKVIAVNERVILEEISFEEPVHILNEGYFLNKVEVTN